MTALVRRAYPWRWWIAVAAVALMVVIVMTATRGTASDDGTYRTADAVTGSVTQTLTATGAIESASRQDLTFQVDGTVDEVLVAVGDEVEAGQDLARLDTTALQDAVTEAREVLAAAEETLAENLEAQTSGTAVESWTTTAMAGSTDVSTVSQQASASQYTVTTAAYITVEDGGSSMTTTVSTTSTSSDALAQARADLEAAQSALIDQYDVAHAALQAFGFAAEQAALACAGVSNAGTVSAGGDGTLADGDETGGETDADVLAEALAACQAATASAMTAQSDSLAQQQALLERAAELNSSVSAVIEAADDGGADTGSSVPPPEGGDSDDAVDTGGRDGASGEPATPDSGTDRGAGAGDDQAGGSLDAPGGGGGGSAAGGASTGRVPTAEDIVADKAAITAAEADLAVAEQQLEYATLSAPVTGTVLSVGVTDGSDVTAGGTSAAITLVADNTFLVQITLPLTSAQLVEVGHEAQVTLLASGDRLDGTVSQVSNLNSGNTFSQSYSATIAVSDPGFEVRIGAAARMLITVAQSSQVLVVPTSAVSDAAGDASVLVVNDSGATEQVSIDVGAVGAEYIEVTSGLAEGDQVVLADLSATLVGDDSDEESSGGLLTGLGEDSDSDSELPQGGPGGGRSGAGPGGGVPGG